MNVASTRTKDPPLEITWIHTSMLPPDGLCSQAGVELYDMLWMQIGLDGEVARDDRLKLAAKRLCLRCPMLMPCLARNMLVIVSHGVIGGMTYKERQYARHVAMAHQALTAQRKRTDTELTDAFIRLNDWLDEHPEIHDMVRNRRHNERYRNTNSAYPIRVMSRLEYRPTGKPARSVSRFSECVDLENNA
ncbi:WhiB family transcriptional regulator [Bifidobacterium tissieri]|uniref:WhiB family transcriptional regulator n=1 Tax=Bifidobacterium tissieri TaxID=1630162 RepID=UPI00168B0494|nr:WhiB family transcriptional regulator [Bifidobacterium tissieri]